MASSSSSDQQPWLPIYIVEEILYRLPPESLTRFKSACKQWLALFRNKEFIYKHLSFAQQQFLKIDTSVEIIDPKNGPRKSIPLPRAMLGISAFEVKGHCDGLLLCRFSLGELAILNPHLKQVRWILGSSTSSCRFYFGFGYNYISRDDGYKILKFYDGRHVVEVGDINRYYKPKVKILDLNNNRWRSLDSSWGWYVYQPYRCISLNGNMYLIAKWEHNSNIFIQSFDFSTEKFQPLCPLPSGESAGFIALSDFRGDRLSLLYERKENIGINEIWVTSKIKNGVVTSWTRLFNIPVLYTNQIRGLVHPVFFIDKNYRIVLRCTELLEDEKHVCYKVYIIGDGGLENLIEMEPHRVRGEDHWSLISGYANLPSLVPVL